MYDEFKSVFKNEIITYLSLRQTELSPDAFRHDKRSISVFDAYLSQVGHTDKDISLNLMSQFVSTLYTGRNKNTAAQYICYVRQFMKYLVGCGYQCTIPERPRTRDNYTPYLYSDDEIAAIINVVDNFKAPKVRKNLLITTELPMIIRLLYSCGLRIGEALSLKMSDVDLENGILILTTTKKNKQRFVPIHSFTTELLRAYCMAMGIIGYPEKFLFPGIDKSTPLTDNTVRNYFKNILDIVGIKRDGYRSFERGPCIHCFRHVFTIRSFKQAEECGIKINYAVPFLSTYLGHDSLYETENYLKFSSELFPDTTQKFEAYTEGIFPEVHFYE